MSCLHLHDLQDTNFHANSATHLRSQFAAQHIQSSQLKLTQNKAPFYTFNLFQKLFETTCSIHTSINPDSDPFQHPDSNSVKSGSFNLI